MMFWHSWNCTPMNLESFHYVIKVLCHTQNTCWQGPFKDFKIWMCFLLLKPSSNVLKFFMGFNILHKKGKMFFFKNAHVLNPFNICCWFWFQTSLMVKKVQNLSSWLKKKLQFEYNLGPHAKKIVFIII